MNVSNCQYADRLFVVGDTYEMKEGHRETIRAIWNDGKNGIELSSYRDGDKRLSQDSTPNDFYRRVARKV